jgi:hypothetical protein
MTAIPRYIYPEEEELPIPNYLSDLELGIKKIETNGGQRKRTRKSKNILDGKHRNNVKRVTRKRKTTRVVQKRRCGSCKQ